MKKIVINIIIFIIFISISNICALKLNPKDSILINKYSKKVPFFRIFVNIEFHNNLELKDFDILQASGLIFDANTVMDLINKNSGIFEVRLRNYEKIIKIPIVKSVNPLLNYVEKGIYQLQLQIKEPHGVRKPVYFQITLPRDANGKQIIELDYSINLTPVKKEIIVDKANNQWLRVHYNNLNYDDIIRFNMYFRNKVDILKMLDMSSYLIDENITLNDYKYDDKLVNYLKQGDNIIYAQEDIIQIIDNLTFTTNSIKNNWEIIKKYIYDTIEYDTQKRDQYFGAQMIYTDMEEMYQNTIETLRRGIGACPDTVRLETAMLRSIGIPARPVGRQGHFYSQFYVPTVGWVDTSLIRDNIFLYVSPDHNDGPYVNWSEKIKVLTRRWDGFLKLDLTQTQ
jgi:hypothetical protein